MAACARDPIRRIAAPAPEGALECSRRVLVEFGYGVTGGDPDRGFLYFERPPGTLLADLLTVEETGGELRVFASTRTHRNRHAPPMVQSLEHVQAVFSTCAAESPPI